MRLLLLLRIASLEKYKLIIDLFLFLIFNVSLLNKSDRNFVMLIHFRKFLLRYTFNFYVKLKIETSYVITFLKFIINVYLKPL